MVPIANANATWNLSLLMHVTEQIVNRRHSQCFAEINLLWNCCCYARKQNKVPNCNTFGCSHLHLFACHNYLLKSMQPTSRHAMAKLMPNSVTHRLIVMHCEAGTPSSPATSRSVVWRLKMRLAGAMDVGAHLCDTMRLCRDRGNRRPSPTSRDNVRLVLAPGLADLMLHAPCELGNCLLGHTLLQPNVNITVGRLAVKQLP